MEQLDAPDQDADPRAQLAVVEINLTQRRSSVVLKRALSGTAMDK